MVIRRWRSSGWFLFALVTHREINQVCLFTGVTCREINRSTRGRHVRSVTVESSSATTACVTVHANLKVRNANARRTVRMAEQRRKIVAVHVREARPGRTAESNAEIRIQSVEPILATLQPSSVPCLALSSWRTSVQRCVVSAKHREARQTTRVHWSACWWATWSKTCKKTNKSSSSLPQNVDFLFASRLTAYNCIGTNIAAQGRRY